MRRGLGPGVVAFVLGWLAVPAVAELPAERTGRVEVLSREGAAHRVWASDAVLERMALVDLEAGEMLGVIDGGWGITTAAFARTRPEIYLPETHYSRGSRGERTDVVTVYDARTLAATAEIVLPPRRAINAVPVANHALSDDDRFLAVFNMIPAQSLSIVDLEKRVLVQEIATPGCGMVYAAGPRRFVMLCADGALLDVPLDAEGRSRGLERGAPFFDPAIDPVTEKAVRAGDRWLFVSFEGWVHPVDVSGGTPRAEEKWSLLSDADRDDSWRIGGSQHLAFHEPSGRLYSLVHQGGPDGHKEPGRELWVYDLAGRERVQRIELRSPGFTYLGVPIEFGQDWIWPFDGLYELALSFASELGIGGIAVTPDAAPLLITASNFSGSLAVYDALTGEFLRRVVTGNMTIVALQAPGAGPRDAP